MLRACVLGIVAMLGCKDKSEQPSVTAPPKERSSLDAGAGAGSGAGSTAGAVTPTTRSLAEELEAIRAEKKLPGLAAAAWRDGKLLETELSPHAVAAVVARNRPAIVASWVERR